jgi:hypothetical protein
MTSKYENPETGSPGFRLFGRTGEAKPSLCQVELQAGGSVRELERMANNLRLAGDIRNTERINLEILSLLEKKIYRKIMAQSRR